MVAEARALRERVLTDLNHRRDTLRAYIDQLRADRDRFTEAYRVVRDTVSDANEMLSRFGAGRPFPPLTAEAGPPISYPSDSEAAHDHTATRSPAPESATRPRIERAPQPRARTEQELQSPAPLAPPSKPRPAPATGIGLGELPGRPEPAPPEAEPEPAPDAGAEDEPAPASSAVSEPEPQAAPDADSEVDALFERIRGMRGDTVEEPRIDFDDAGATDQPRGGDAAKPADAPVLVESPPGPRPAPTDGDPELLSRRDELIMPIAQELVRHAKRVLQNEQNEILDGLRRQRGRATPDKLLPALSQQVDAWSEVLAPAITEAYVAARTAAEPAAEPVSGAPPRMVAGMVEVLVTPLRDRLLAAVEDSLGDDANPDVIAHRIGARYREWKGEELDNRIRDLLAAVYARGVYDAAPEGARLRWVPGEQGQCPDADDNALEPTRRGERFPTGQQFPPAHPGCRCLLAVVDEARSPE
jgi:hypothetical protein